MFSKSKQFTPNHQRHFPSTWKSTATPTLHIYTSNCEKHVFPRFAVKYFISHRNTTRAHTSMYQVDKQTSDELSQTVKTHFILFTKTRGSDSQRRSEFKHLVLLLGHQPTDVKRWIQRMEGVFMYPLRMHFWLPQTN